VNEPIISQAEALLAVLGMRPIISHAIESIGEAEWRRVLSIEADIDDAARALVLGKSKPVPEAKGVDYMSTLRDLSTAYQPHQVEAMLSKLPAWFSDNAGAFLMLAQKAFSYLGSQLPRQVKVSLAGPENLPRVPTRLLDTFLSLLEVLDDPLRALALAGNAQLLGSQIKALDLVFPSVTDYMRKAVAREVTAARARSAGFKMPYHAEMGAEKLIGQDLTSPVLRHILAVPPPKPPQQQKPQSAAPPADQMTRTQRTDNIGATDHG
jgi:hypothetical protein